MIPAEHKAEIIQSGMNFMRAITEVYGTDEGMKLWDTIASTLDPDIKGQIFFAMLTGEYNNIITINSHRPGANYGARERNAMFKLEKRGMIEITERTRWNDVNRGYTQGGTVFAFKII